LGGPRRVNHERPVRLGRQVGCGRLGFRLQLALGFFDTAVRAVERLVAAFEVVPRFLCGLADFLGFVVGLGFVLDSLALLQRPPRYVRIDFLGSIFSRLSERCGNLSRIIYCLGERVFSIASISSNSFTICPGVFSRWREVHTSGRSYTLSRDPQGLRVEKIGSPILHTAGEGDVCKTDCSPAANSQQQVVAGLFEWGVL
jgi:hypothetical protein